MPETNPECIWKTARCRVCHPVTHPDRTKIVTKQSKQSIPTKATWQWLCTNVSQLRELTCAARGPLCPWSQQAVLWDLSGTNSVQGCQLTNFVRKKVGHKSQKFLNPFAHRSHFRRAFGQPMVSFKSPEHGLRLKCNLHRLELLNGNARAELGYPALHHSLASSQYHAFGPFAACGKHGRSWGPGYEKWKLSTSKSLACLKSPPSPVSHLSTDIHHSPGILKEPFDPFDSFDLRREVKRTSDKLLSTMF